MQLENALAAHGVAIQDVAAVLHTHCHIDHAGQDDRFPMTTPVVMNRRELEHSVSGLMGAQYPPEYVKHHIDRLHTPGALRLLDLELSGPDQIYDGIVCEAAGGHTEGSMNILVEPPNATACICGDVIYESRTRSSNRGTRYSPTSRRRPATTLMTKRQEKAAIKKALNFDYVLPLHDFPGSGRRRPRRRPTQERGSRPGVVGRRVRGRVRRAGAGRLERRRARESAARSSAASTCEAAGVHARRRSRRAARARHRPTDAEELGEALRPKSRRPGRHRQTPRGPPPADPAAAHQPCPSGPARRTKSRPKRSSVEIERRPARSRGAARASRADPSARAGPPTRAVVALGLDRVDRYR